jgi:energy-converting hydrogenase Eha subunit C
MNQDLEKCIQLIAKILRRERLQKLLVAGITLLGALFLGIIASRLEEARASTLLAVLSIGIFLVGFIFLIQILRHWQAESHPLVQILQHEPKQIVWVYAINIEMMPAGIKFWNEHTFSIHLLNKQEIQLKMHASQISPLRRYLQKLLPHATFGYSHERAQWYTANPMLLYNTPEDKENSTH